MYLCKNKGFMWYWGAGNSVDISSNLVTSFGLSLASVSIGVSLGLNFDIHNKECMFEVSYILIFTVI